MRARYAVDAIVAEWRCFAVAWKRPGLKTRMRVRSRGTRTAWRETRRGSTSHASGCTNPFDRELHTAGGRNEGGYICRMDPRIWSTVPSKSSSTRLEKGKKEDVEETRTVATKMQDHSQKRAETNESVKTMKEELHRVHPRFPNLLCPNRRQIPFYILISDATHRSPPHSTPPTPPYYSDSPSQTP